MQTVRGAIFNAFIGLSVLFMGILCLPTLLLPRKWAAASVRAWCMLILNVYRIIAGVTYEVRGRDHLHDGPALVASKHQSMWDTIVVFALFPDPAMVLKKELMKIPLYGWFARKSAHVEVDRDAHASALRRLVAQGKDRLSHGRPIVVFPEGTRTLPGKRIKYKPGVAALYTALDVPCVPVALNSGLHWQRNTKWHRPGTIILEILPPIAPGLKRKQFLAELEDRIETASVRLYKEGAARLGLDTEENDAPDKAVPAAD